MPVGSPQLSHLALRKVVRRLSAQGELSIRRILEGAELSSHRAGLHHRQRQPGLQRKWFWFSVPFMTRGDAGG